MKRFWNNQIYCECHLITLWNAAIYYGIKVPTRYEEEYTADCKKGYAISGACLRDKHVIKKLGLKPIKGQLNWRWIKANCPIEFLIFCHRGLHSVLGVDVDVKKKKVLLANYARGRLHWINIDKLIKMHYKRDYPDDRDQPIKWIQDF